MSILLPTELLFLIFSHIDKKKDLSQCALVNKYFHQLVTPRLWRDPFKLNNNQKEILASLIESCIQYSKPTHNPLILPLGHYIRKIVSYKTDTGDTIRLMAKEAPFLEDLELHGRYYFRYYTLDRIISEIPRLRRIAFCNLYLHNHELVSLGRQAFNLIHLKLKGCAKLNSLTPLRNCLHLQALYIMECGPFNDQVGPDIASLDHLSHLRIVNCSGLKLGLLIHFLPTDTTAPLPLLTHFTFIHEPDESINNHKVQVEFQQAHPLIQHRYIHPWTRWNGRRRWRHRHRHR